MLLVGTLVKSSRNRITRNAIAAKIRVTVCRKKSVQYSGSLSTLVSPHGPERAICQGHCIDSVARRRYTQAAKQMCTIKTLGHIQGPVISKSTPGTLNELPLYAPTPITTIDSLNKIRRAILRCSSISASSHADLYITRLTCPHKRFSGSLRRNSLSKFHNRLLVLSPLPLVSAGQSKRPTLNGRFEAV